MKKLILISLLTLGSSLFAADIGIRITTPIGNNTNLDIGFRSDDHRYDNRYKNFDYHRNGYYDDFGYFYGYFDRYGYFYNNIYFVYDNRYTYYDRLHHRGYFKPNRGHYRTYRYHDHNDWNRKHQFREVNKPIYGAYYDRNYNKQRIVEKQYNNKKEYENRNNSNHQNDRNYKEQKSNEKQRDYRNNSNQQDNRNKNDKNNKDQIIEDKRNNR
jgi:hypothetical protein